MPVVILVAVLAFAVRTVLADVVERRGAEGELRGQVVGLDDDGISIRTDSGATPTSSRGTASAACTPTRPIRASRISSPSPTSSGGPARVERDDATLAEPLLERLFPTYQGRTSQTALVVAEGLLRCRLAGHRPKPSVPGPRGDAPAPRRHHHRRLRDAAIGL